MAVCLEDNPDSPVIRLSMLRRCYVMVVEQACRLEADGSRYFPLKCVRQVFLTADATALRARNARRAHNARSVPASAYEPSNQRRELQDYQPPATSIRTLKPYA